MSLRTASSWMRQCGWGFLLLAAASLGWASEVHTNPLNRDPLVREAYEHFYNLDYPGAVERFERFHEEHPGDPQATAMLLDAELFQELYRLDLLDTTFYANDGFLTGRHATEEDPKTRDRILGLADEAIREADWRIDHNPNDVDALFARGWVRSLKCTYVAMVRAGIWRGLSAGYQGQGRRQARAATRSRIMLTPSWWWGSTSTWWARCPGRSSC